MKQPGIEIDIVATKEWFNSLIIIYHLSTHFTVYFHMLHANLSEILLLLIVLLRLLLWRRLLLIRKEHKVCKP